MINLLHPKKAIIISKLFPQWVMGALTWSVSELIPSPRGRRIGPTDEKSIDALVSLLGECEVGLPNAGSPITREQWVKWGLLMHCTGSSQFMALRADYNRNFPAQSRTPSRTPSAPVQLENNYNFQPQPKKDLFKSPNLGTRTTENICKAASAAHPP